MATREQLIEDFADHKYATGEKFARLINSMKVVQEPVAAPAASGTSLSFIDSIEQDADGKITATKKTLDLSNAHELNPFKGWWKTGDTLPTSGFDGAYLYFKDTTQSPAVTTIYQWNGTTYADTGTVVDESNVNTFGSGQTLNAVKIKDENGEMVSGPAGVLSAEAGKVIGDEVFQNVYIDTNPSTNYYVNDVAELYFVDDLTPSVRGVYLRWYQSTTSGIVLRAKNDTNTNIFTCSLYTGVDANNFIYELRVSTTDDATNYPVGKLVALIAFKDVQHFKNKSLGSEPAYCLINQSRARNLKFNPLSLKYLAVLESSAYAEETVSSTVSSLVVDNLTTDDATKALSAKQGKVIGDELFQNVYIDTDLSTNPYANDVAELYLVENIPVDTDKYMQFKSYLGLARLIYRVSNNFVFDCRIGNLTSLSDGVVYPLNVYSTNDDENYPVEKLIGYVVFKNIEHFAANPSESGTKGKINIDRARNLNQNPKSVQQSTLQITLDAVEDEIESLDFPTYIKGVEVNLPDEIVVSKGDRLQIFWRNVCTAFNPYAFDVVGICDVGLSYPRYFVFDAPNDVPNNTTYTLTVKVRDNNCDTISSKSTTIRVVDKISNPSTNKNVLIVGASATANGNIIHELNRRLKTSTGYEYKFTFSSTIPDVHVNDVYVNNGHKYKITEIGTDYVGAVKTVVGSTALDGRVLTKESGDETSPSTITLQYYIITYPVVYDKPNGLGLSNITFVGNTTPLQNEPELKQEAHSGWSWKDFSTVGRFAYRFFITGQPTIDVREGSVYSGAGTLKFTITEINLTEGEGYISATYTGSGTQPQSGTLTLYSGNGSNTITYYNWNADSGNPFWNNTTQQLDFQNYATNVIHVSSIDLVITHLGINDLFSSRTIDDTISYMDTFCTTLHTQYPNAKIIISTLPLPSPYGGMTSNYGASENSSYWNKAKQFWVYAQAFNDFVATKDYVYLSTAFHTFDAENLYPTRIETVDNRSTNTEVLQTNGVHPINIGGYTVADDIYHTIMMVLV